MVSIWKLPSVLVGSASLLAGCGMLNTTRTVEKPPVALVTAVGASVTVTDDRSGSPVDLRGDQTLAVRLRFAGSTHSDWTLLAFEPGVLKQVGATRYEQDTTAAVYGEVAGTQVWRFEPGRPGTVVLNFELRAPRSREPAVQTATFTVTVR